VALRIHSVADGLARANVYFRCGFVDDVALNDGLLRVFLGRRDDDNVVDLSHPPSANAWRESAAAALMLGAPAAAVSRHMKAAGGALAKLGGWKEQPAVTALISFGLANALLPAPRDGSKDQQEQDKLHRSSMDDAQAIHEELPVKPWCASDNPVNISGWPDGGGEWGRAAGSHPAFVVADSEWHAVAARREGVNVGLGRVSRGRTAYSEARPAHSVE